MDLLKLIRLCHLLLFTASKLKVFGDDAFRKVTSRCKVAAAVVNYWMEVNRVFFPVTAGRQRVPGRVRQINEETFKSAVLEEIIKCVGDANIQRHYVGDGDGDISVAGLGLPPSALTDGSIPSVQTLFKRSLHEVKGLLESKACLRNPDSAEAKAARQEALVLEGINVIMSGGEINAAHSNNNPVVNKERSVNKNDNDHNGDRNGSRGSEECSVNDSDRNDCNQDRNGLRGSPVASLLTMEDDTNSKLRKSPATMMAGASVLSQQAALKEADDLKSMIEVQKEELVLRNLPNLVVINVIVQVGIRIKVVLLSIFNW
jgi:hypothetical protein